jgi:hypothetical protein
MVLNMAVTGGQHFFRPGIVYFRRCLAPSLDLKFSHINRRKEEAMSAMRTNNRDRSRINHQSSLSDAGGLKMKLARQIAKAMDFISRGVATQHPLKIVGGLALGAVLLGATAVHFPSGSTHGTDTPGGSNAVQDFQAMTYDDWRLDPPLSSELSTEEGARLSPGARLRIAPEDEWPFGPPYVTYVEDFSADGPQGPPRASTPSYDQQRITDSVQERLEVRQVLEAMLQESPP